MEALYNTDVLLHQQLLSTITHGGGTAMSRLRARNRHTVRIALAMTVAGLVTGSCGGGAPVPVASPPSESAPELSETPSPVAVPEKTAIAEESPTVVPFAGQALASFTDSHFAGSGNCAACHSSLTDSTGQDVSIDAHWRSTMMANSARDPLWQAKVSSEVARNPSLSETIEDKCATCHMPMAHTQAGAEGEKVGIFEPGFLGPDHPSNVSAMDGVSCALCHQIQDNGLGRESSFSGHYTIDIVTKPPDRLAFGPFPRPFQNPMRMSVGFVPVEGAQVHDSGLCATCHTLFTPYVDAAGTVLGTFPEQTPYLEWEQSAYADGAVRHRSCQDCHMPIAAGPAVISNRPGGRLEARSPFAQHHFVGGNVFMLRVFEAFGPTLGLTAGTIDLDGTVARTRHQLAIATAALSLADVQVNHDTLTVALEIASSVGHKLPSGFPSRRVWIHLTILDANGGVVFESGQPQPDGSIAGNDADADSARYEPHYDVISSADQVQIYEAVMQNSDGAVTYTLLRGASYTKDNRLLPLGFDKQTASHDVAVHGAAASDENFVGGSDRITYQVDTPAHTGTLTVTAALLYQTVSYRFFQDLSQDRTAQVERLMGYYDRSFAQPEVIQTTTETVN